MGTGFGFGNAEISSEPDSADAVLPGLINLSLGYTFTERIHADFRLERNGYLSATEDSVQATSMNYLFGPSIALINNDKFGLRAGGLIGISRFVWTSEIPSEMNHDVHIHGKGMAYQLNLHGDLKLSGPVALFFEAGYAGFNLFELTAHYDSMNPSEEVWMDDQGTADESDDTNVTFKSTQGTARIGLNLRF